MIENRKPEFYRISWITSLILVQNEKTRIIHHFAEYYPIYSSEQIDIEAYWWTGSGDIVEGFGQYVRGSGVPFPDAYYPISLRNAIRGSDHNVDPDFRIRFNDTYNWYFGTDGQTPPNQYDFVTAALKAIGQKLGLESRTHICYVDLGCFGSSGEYYVYEVFVVNGQGQQLISFPHASPELKTQLTSNNLYFSGPAAVAVHGGTQPKLYAPAIWQVVNVEHLLLDEAIYPPEGYNALMTAILQPGEAHHDPGPLARAMLYDLGWPRPAQAPVLNPLPNQFLLVNTSRDHAIDLWDYANDPDTAVWNLVFSLVNSPAPQAGISFESGHYINIHPDMDWTGSTQVTIEVEDPTNLTDSRSFDVFVVEQIYQTFLPAISGP